MSSPRRSTRLRNASGPLAIALSPHNGAEIEVDRQPQRRENQRAENDGLLSDVAARSDGEGVGRCQECIGEPLADTGVARLSEANAELINDSCCTYRIHT